MAVRVIFFLAFRLIIYTRLLSPPNTLNPFVRLLSVFNLYLSFHYCFFHVINAIAFTELSFSPSLLFFPLLLFPTVPHRDPVSFCSVPFCLGSYLVSIYLRPSRLHCGSCVSLVSLVSLFSFISLNCTSMYLIIRLFYVSQGSFIFKLMSFTSSTLMLIKRLSYLHNNIIHLYCHFNYMYIIVLCNEKSSYVNIVLRSFLFCSKKEYIYIYRVFPNISHRPNINRSMIFRTKAK